MNFRFLWYIQFTEKFWKLDEIIYIFVNLINKMPNYFRNFAAFDNDY